MGQIVNVFVPVVDAGIGLAKTIDAAEKGDYKRAGESGYGAAKAVAGVLAVGVGAGVARGKGGGGVRVGGERWRSFEPGAKACQNNCEIVAQSIQRSIGGDIKVIAGPGALLGRVRNSVGEFVNPAGSLARGWSDHYVVVKEGRVYDALTGPKGMSITAYKQLWEHGDVLNFGF